jgi:hypothetical protein
MCLLRKHGGADLLDACQRERLASAQDARGFENWSHFN